MIRSRSGLFRCGLPRPAALLAGAALALGAAAAPAPTPARAQVPDTFKNLKVLPDTISRDHLVGVMRGFASGLGVRCDYCHVAPEGTPFSEWPFDKDDKTTKRKARFMLRMVEYLNGQRLPGLPEAADAEREDPPVRVTCHTCHHGVPVPRSLDEVLVLTAGTAGVDSAVAEYGDLRERYFGRGAYDFGEGTLIDAARTLAGRGDQAGARSLLELNLKQFPESIPTWLAIAGVEEARGDTARALDALRKASGLDPGEREARRIRREIERLGGQPR